MHITNLNSSLHACHSDSVRRNFILLSVIVIIACGWWYSCDGRNLHFNRIAGRCNIKSCMMTAVKRQLGDGCLRRRALPDYLSRVATRPACQLTVVSIDFPWPSSCLTFSKFMFGSKAISLSFVHILAKNGNYF